MDYALPYIGTIVTVKIDRAIGTKHLQHSFVYCLNYGFVPDTIAPDGEGIDAYVLGIYEPLEEFVGRCIAVIRRTNDTDDKLVVAQIGIDYSNEYIAAVTEFQERFFTSTILR